MTFRWPWRTSADKESGAMRHADREQDSRLQETVKASERSEKLIQRVNQLAPVVEARANLSKRLRNENGFATLVYEALGYRGPDEGLRS